ncbi:MAG: AraC family transcriptional regulator [Verrucomicrobiota bacterium]
MDQIGREFKDAYFRRQPDARNIIDLFEYLPGVYFYAKDANHRYFAVNRLVLEDVFGLESEEDLLGRTDSDFQAPALAEAYHAEDRRVMEQRETIPNEVWLVPHVSGRPRWYVSTKTPVFNAAKEVIGIVGVMYPIQTPEEQAAYFRELLPVIQFMEANYRTDISMEKMTQMAELSSTQFNQRFRLLLRMSPSEFLLRLRVEAARNLLATGQDALGEVAVEVGFYDQSHFTKRFRKVTGMTPRQYRMRFRGALRED